METTPKPEKTYLSQYNPKIGNAVVANVAMPVFMRFIVAKKPNMMNNKKH